MVVVEVVVFWVVASKYFSPVCPKKFLFVMGDDNIFVAVSYVGDFLFVFAV